MAHDGGIEYYATEEGDVSTDSKLTSVLNKPGTQHLEVYWDGADSNSYPGAGTEVFDLSGNGVTGTITGTNAFDTEYNAWVSMGVGITLFHPQRFTSTHSCAIWFDITSPVGRQYIAYVDLHLAKFAII